MERLQVERRVGGELRLARVAEVFGAVNPRPDDQPLQALLGFAQFDEVEVGNRSAPRIVPAGGVVFGNVLVLGQMIDHAGAVVLPEAVVIAVAHGLDQPGFIVRRELQRSGPGAQRQARYVVADVASQVEQRGCRGGIRRRARRGRGCVRGSGGGVAHGQHPVEPAQLEGAVVADTVPAEIRHGVARQPSPSRREHCRWRARAAWRRHRKTPWCRCRHPTRTAPRSTRRCRARRSDRPRSDASVLPTGSGRARPE